MTLQPVVLEGRWVRLEPLHRHHEAALMALSPEEEVYRYFSASLAVPEGMREWLQRALDASAEGTELPFATVERSSAIVVGSTRYFDIRLGDRAVEIGHTWLAKPWWRTAINTEAKFLMLRHLFDTLRCQRVTLKTDAMNERSQRAIERLGAVREGVLRKHMIVQGGRTRDTVYYSILDEEWPGVRDRLRSRLYGATGEATPLASR